MSHLSGHPPIDILILTNGPGEVTTWVKPVVERLRFHLGDDRTQVRISVVLSPCAHATGREAETASHYPEVDRVQAAVDFFPFLLWGKTAADWDWRDRGVVLFLGGDQFYTVVIGKRLGYQTVVYAEWEGRWLRWIDHFAVMSPQAIQNAPPRYAAKFTLVGDLMQESQGMTANPEPVSPTAPLIGLLPGSKANKLGIGMPLLLATAVEIHRRCPEARLVLPVAPTVNPQILGHFANPEHNRLIPWLGWGQAELQQQQQEWFLQTPEGVKIHLYQPFPAYGLLSQCDLCLTTVGANTAELGALAVPMLVLIPTQQMEAMYAWDGLPGLIASLPGVGRLFLKVFNRLMLRYLGLLGQGRRKRWLAWPNIWAQQEVVPELIGPLQPANLADRVWDYLQHPEKLQAMRDHLRQIRGQTGAADRLAQIVVKTIAG